MNITPDCLINWRLEDFTKSGDNFCCDVKKIKVTWKDDGQMESKSYVAKMYRCFDSSEVLQTIIEHANRKEGLILLQVIPKLNHCLQQYGVPDIKVPKAFFCSSNPKSHVLIMEDLRAIGYRMLDRRIGMSIDHATIVMKELGKFHAASKIMESQISRSLDILFPEIKGPYDDCISSQHPFSKHYHNIIRNQMFNAIDILKHHDGFDFAIDWITENLDNGCDIILKSKIPTGHMNCLIHGDCWNNNIVFKYDCGKPCDVRLLDFQGTRKSSPSCDLLYFLYLGLEGHTRKEYKDTLLNIYYLEFKKICETAGIGTPFTIKDLKKDMEDKLPYAIISGINRLPLIMAGEGCTNVADLFKDGNANNLNKLLQNEAYVERFLHLFDDLRSQN